MIIKLPDGTQTDLVVGSMVTLTSAVFGDFLGVGPFEVLAFEGDLPDLLLFTSEAGDQKIAPISIDLIASVSNKELPKVTVTFPDGTEVLVDATLGPLLEAVIKNNQELMTKLADLLSGEEVKQMQLKLDAMAAERDAAIAYAAKIKDAIPSIESAEASVENLITVLKG